MGEYTVHLVGESNYQPAIRNCDEGDPVDLIAEPENRYDPHAVRVANSQGETIGYIERGHWLQRMMHLEKTAHRAEIRHIMGGEKGKPSRGIVLTVWTGVHAQEPPPLPSPASASPAPIKPQQRSRVPVPVIVILVIGALYLIGALIDA